ncbi:RNA-binding post-transcriptional regulator [Lachnellula subtilissima]|uniref:RNA-binding post-transcriptional regulator n=1 Tax=Lachnellula subtilissima TaxID=602034 RepID=A0A8H8U633_9HELO|nr:RNA-binding post-transcriptional regulator [Lachnellula subtilissima]
MSHQYQDMYTSDFSNRSPGSNRYGSGLTLNRQPSRHFDSYGGGQMQQGLYTSEDHVASRFDSVARFPPVNANPHSNSYYDSQTWNYGAPSLNGNNMNVNGGANTMGGTGRVKSQTARRAGLPSNWMDSSMPPPMPQQNMGMLSHQHQMNSHNGPYNQQLQGGPPRMDTPPEHDELIPTAIVIKNIPFAVKKEQLVQLMTDMHLPLPYAFNYHFDGGVFRGLAFANFTTPEETSVVIDTMNHMELQGRKLRVEYKKMLPMLEREKIEREKREKRGQLEEQHRPMPNASVPSLNAQASMNSINSSHIPSSPSPVSLRGQAQIPLDMNDPVILGFYGDLIGFKNDASRDIYVFPSTVPPADRRTIHTLAHNMGLEHRSEGTGDGRCVQVYKTRHTTISPAVPQLPQSSYYNDASRRGLNRAATIDFGESRANDGNYYNHSLRNQGSGLLDIPGSPGLGVNHNNLRAAKSFADLRSYTPSPSQSVQSYPTNASATIARYTDYGPPSQASGTPNLTPTSAGGQNPLNNRDESSLLNGLNGLSLGFDRPNAGRTATNGRMGQEREIPSAGPIGSQRPMNGSAYDENPRNGATARPERQPRGPGSEWGAGFQRPRQNGHRNQGSGELDLNSIETEWDDNIAQDSSDRSLPSNNRYM